MSFMHNKKLTNFSKCENKLKCDDFCELQVFFDFANHAFPVLTTFIWLARSNNMFKSMHLKNLTKCTLNHQGAAFYCMVVSCLEEEVCS